MPSGSFQLKIAVGNGIPGLSHPTTFVKSLLTLTSRETISYMELVLAIYGIPIVVISENATQFTSSEFKTFKKEWGFKDITSSPHFPQSNGFIERTVQTVKNCL